MCSSVSRSCMSRWCIAGGLPDSVSAQIGKRRTVFAYSRLHGKVSELCVRALVWFYVLSISPATGLI